MPLTGRVTACLGSLERAVHRFTVEQSSSASIEVHFLYWVYACREDTITKAAQKVSAAVGDEGLQLLINNAGLMQLAPLECLDLSEVK